jgi:heme/copper-type cytochrome/quinol oxidase subunit 2
VDAGEANQIYRGQCAELCGTGHHLMLFNVIALSPADYDTWLAALVAKSNATPAPAPSGTVLKLSAKDIKFNTDALEVPADAPFAITFDNQDPSGVTHNVAIRDSSGTEIAKPDTINGGTSTTYTYGALKAGTYTFFCSIHSNMTGTLTVK